MLGIRQEKTKEKTPKMTETVSVAGRKRLLHTSMNG